MRLQKIIREMKAKLKRFVKAVIGIWKIEFNLTPSSIYMGSDSSNKMDSKTDIDDLKQTNF